MKHIVLAALCLLSSLAHSTEVEEVLVVARRIEILIEDFSKHHRQNPITGNWHYVAEPVKTIKVDNDVAVVVKADHNA